MEDLKGVEVNKKETSLEIGPLYPIGNETLPPIQCSIKNPYINDISSKIIASALAVSGIGSLMESLKQDNPLNRKVSRREFLKIAGTAMLGLAIAPLLPPVRTEAAEILRGIDSRVYHLLTDPDLFEKYWLREKIGNQIYNLREKEDDSLQIKYTTTEGIAYDGNETGRIHHFNYTSPIIDKIPKINREIMVYEVRKGNLTPAFHSDSSIVSFRADEAHKIFNTTMAVSFNATSPQALAMGESIKAKEEKEYEKYLLPIVYGSSSIFIPRDIKENSPIWKHAKDRLTNQEMYFRELNFRRGDKSHRAIGFKTDGTIRLVEQAELFNCVQRRSLSPDLQYLALNQFAFNPQETGIPEEFGWTSNRHRNANMLLVDEDGRQMILSGSLDIFLRNKDYLSVVKQIEYYLNTRFVLAACLDVGLATGFTLKNHEEGIRKPIEKNFHNKNGQLNPGLIHTSSIFLIQDNI